MEGASPTAASEEQLGFALSSIGQSSIVDSVRFRTLSGAPLASASPHLLAHIRSFLRYSKGRERIAALRWLSVSGNGEKAAFVLSDGAVLIVNLPEGGVQSRYEEKTDEAQSVVTSIAALSVTDPLDVQQINWAEWATSDLLWVSNLQGNVGLLRAAGWEDVLGEDGMQFGEGACVSASRQNAERAKCLVLENRREWMKDLEGDHVIVNAYALHGIEEVTPWEKFARCIRSREFGTALQLAKRFGFDEDLV